MHEETDYRIFTGPRRLSRDIHYLEGLLTGIVVDRLLTEGELTALNGWCDEHAEAAARHPFTELVPLLRAAVADGVITEEERDDVVWLCRQLVNPECFSAATSDMQRLHGLLAGIAADRVVTAEELGGLRGWLADHDQLKGLWPYDEIDAVVLKVLDDGVVDEEEHRFLLHFCAEFLAEYPSLLLEDLASDDLVRCGVCAACPEISFTGRVFCFTGQGSRHTRAELAAMATQLGATAVANIKKGVDYLVVGSAGSECWAFSCYGRKVEAAMTRRRQGDAIAIVHEYDYLDAVADAG